MSTIACYGRKLQSIRHPFTRSGRPSRPFGEGLDKPHPTILVIKGVRYEATTITAVHIRVAHEFECQVFERRWHMKPLSNDLRERICNAVDNHEGSRRKLAARFGVNVSTITRLLQLRRQTGSSEPRPHGGGVAPTLDHDALERLRGLVEETPDATLEALKQKLGVSGRIMIICRALQKLGLPLKKKSPHASERDTPEVREKRRSFRKKVELIESRRLVFVDETGVTTTMTRAYGRAPRGERVDTSPPWRSRGRSTQRHSRLTWSRSSSRPCVTGTW